MYASMLIGAKKGEKEEYLELKTALLYEWKQFSKNSTVLENSPEGTTNSTRKRKRKGRTDNKIPETDKSGLLVFPLPRVHFTKPRITTTTGGGGGDDGGGSGFRVWQKPKQHTSKDAAGGILVENSITAEKSGAVDRGKRFSELYNDVSKNSIHTTYGDGGGGDESLTFDIHVKSLKCMPQYYPIQSNGEKLSV